MQAESIPIPSQRCRTIHSDIHTCLNSYNRLSLAFDCSGQGHNMRSGEVTPHCCTATASRELHCPVCLHTCSFPVQTNCGHLFCAPCLISYWKHGSWMDAVSCPLCRQKVSVMHHLFRESGTDKKEREVLGHIRDYNKRYSGAPRRVSDYLRDAPLFLSFLLRSLGNMGGLVWLFLLRVAVCGVGAVLALVSPPETGPRALDGALELLDDLVVVFLLLFSMLKVHQQVASERTDGGTRRTRSTRTRTHGILSDAL